MWEPGRHRWSKPDSILVATDLGDIDRLFPIALREAREEGARLVLLARAHSRQLPAGRCRRSPLLQYHPSDRLDREVPCNLCRGSTQGWNPLRGSRAGRRASEQIVLTASRLHVDRILLGTRSRGRWGKLLLGSVAEQVLRSAPVPVLTVGPEAHQSVPGAGAVRTVLHATSLSKASGPSAALACEIAQITASRLVLMHVLPSRGAHEAAHTAGDELRRAATAHADSRGSSLLVRDRYADSEGRSGDRDPRTGSCLGCGSDRPGRLQGVHRRHPCAAGCGLRDHRSRALPGAHPLHLQRGRRKQPDSPCIARSPETAGSADPKQRVPVRLPERQPRPPG